MLYKIKAYCALHRFESVFAMTMKNITRCALVISLLLVPVLSQANTQRSVTITAQDGLGIDPVYQIAGTARRFSSNVRLTSQDRTVNAKDLFKLQTLRLHKGIVLTVSADGPDERAAAESVARVIASSR